MRGVTTRTCAAGICGGMLIVIMPVCWILTQSPGRIWQVQQTLTITVCLVLQSLTTILEGSILRTVASIVIQSPPFQHMKEPAEMCDPIRIEKTAP